MFWLTINGYLTLLWWSDHRKRKHHQSSLVGIYWLFIMSCTVQSRPVVHAALSTSFVCRWAPFILSYDMNQWYIRLQDVVLLYTYYQDVTSIHRVSSVMDLIVVPSRQLRTLRDAILPLSHRFLPWMGRPLVKVQQMMSESSTRKTSWVKCGTDNYRLSAALAIRHQNHRNGFP